MKKTLTILAMFLLIGSLLPRLNFKNVMAVDVVQDVEYALPYPGMLPDNPLYFFKVLRDRVITMMIADQVQKSFYLLLLSDKRLSAGQVLINSGKEEAGANTLIQSEEYFKNSADLAAKLPKEKRGDLVSKLVVSGAKHTQVISSLGVKITKNGQKSWQTAVDDNVKSQSRVMDLYLQK